MIKVKNLTKKFQQFTAVDNASFEVNSGEIVGFLGPNGAGKTTTMRILAGFIPMTSGEVTVENFDVFEDSLKIREMIGYLPETTPLYPDMIVLEYLNFMAELKKVKQEDRETQLNKIVDKCGLNEVKDDLIKNLSKGYKQRVGLAQALIGEPKVLILDEPTIGLDPKQILEIRKLIKELGKEKTIILSTHILQEVSAVCDKVVIINKGKIVATDTPDNLTKRLSGGMVVNITVRAGSEEVVRCLTNLEKIEKVEKVSSQGVENVFRVHAAEKVDPREIIASAIVRNGWGLLEMSKEKIGLEEIFIKLTGDKKS